MTSILSDIICNVHVDINAAQLSENMRLIQKLAGCDVLASVKANGYGHDYEIASRAFLKGGATYLGIARLEEGLLLRQRGFTTPILVIGGLLAEEMPHAAQAGLDFFVWRPEHIAALRNMGKQAQPVRVHIKVDTGMGRLGCLPSEALNVARALQSISGVEITGLATHLASADVMGVPDTAKQIAAFNGVIAALADIAVRPRLIHAANSAGTLFHPEAHFNMVRVGISAYGEPPDAGLSVPTGVKPALTWRARLVETKILPAGHGVGYGSQYKTTSPQRIGVVPVGYGDGYRRLLPVNTVLIDGQERKVLGRVCMDHCMVDLDGFGDITGAEVVLLGAQGDKTISATEIAQRWGTISYDVFTGIAARVARKEV